MGRGMIGNLYFEHVQILHAMLRPLGGAGGVVFRLINLQICLSREDK